MPEAAYTHFRGLLLRTRGSRLPVAKPASGVQLHLRNEAETDLKLALVSGAPVFTHRMRALSLLLSSTASSQCLPTDLGPSSQGQRSRNPTHL